MHSVEHLECVVMRLSLARRGLSRASSPLTLRPRLGSLHKKNSPCVLHQVTNELLHAAVLCAPHPQVLAHSLAVAPPSAGRRSPPLAESSAAASCCAPQRARAALGPSALAAAAPAQLALAC